MDAELIMTAEELQQDRAKWLEARKQGIGGSEASSIAGVNPHKSMFALYMEKTGQVEPNDISDLEMVLWGTRLEGNVADYFAETEGKKIRKCGLLRNKKYPFLLASPDRLIVGEEAGLEIKTTAAWNRDEWKDDEIPANYMVQCLHYLLVTGLQRWYICCLLGGQHYVRKVIERKDVEDDLQALLEAEIKFWNDYVLTGNLPPVDASATCTEALKKRYPDSDNQGTVQLDDEMEQKLIQRDEYKQEIDKLKVYINGIENDLRAEMAEKAFGKSASYKVIYKSSTMKGFDTKAFEKDYPDLYEKYKKDTPIRKLFIKLNKAKKAGLEE